MKAILLAAGIGKRLKPITEQTPKSLIRIGEKSVLERMLNLIIKMGIKDIYIVVGHLAEKIKESIGVKYGAVAINYVLNLNYKMGSVLSVLVAQECFDDDILLMDSDVIFEGTILKRLIESKNKNCFLMDKNYKETGEEMKIAALNRKVVQIARRVTEKCDVIGEGIGFFKLSKRYLKELLTALEETIDENEESDYEAALDKLVKRIPVGFEDVTGLKWTEIDFPEDIEKAKALGL